MRIIEKYVDDPCDTLGVMSEWRTMFRRTVADNNSRDAKALLIRQKKSDEEASRLVLSLTADSRKRLDGQTVSTPSVTTAVASAAQNTTMGLRMPLKRNAAVLDDNSMVEQQRYMTMMSTAAVAAKQQRLDVVEQSPAYCQSQHQYLNLLAPSAQSSLQGLAPPAAAMQHSHHQQLDSAFFAFRNGSNLGHYPFVYYGGEEAAGVLMSNNDERPLHHQHPQHFSSGTSSAAIQIEQAMSSPMGNLFHHQQQQTAISRCDGNMK